MAQRININADLGESYGPFQIGDDAALLDLVASASIACGMHGGDPSVMRRTLAEAAARGVSIGAHPGLNDLWGFGRRRIPTAAEDVEYLVAYQIGALRALAGYESQPLSHVKLHGALYAMADEDLGLAEAVSRAIRTAAPDLIHLGPPGGAQERASRALGLRIAREGFVDRTYEVSGALTSRGMAGAVIREPELAAEQAVRLASEGVVIARTGETVALEVDSLCVHGDEPGASEIARAVRAALESAGIEIVPLPRMM